MLYKGSFIFDAIIGIVNLCYFAGATEYCGGYYGGIPGSARYCRDFCCGNVTHRFCCSDCGDSIYYTMHHCGYRYALASGAVLLVGFILVVMIICVVGLRKAFPKMFRRCRLFHLSYITRRGNSIPNNASTTRSEIELESIGRTPASRGQKPPSYFEVIRGDLSTSSTGPISIISPPAYSESTNPPPYSVGAADDEESPLSGHTNQGADLIDGPPQQQVAHMDDQRQAISIVVNNESSSIAVNEESSPIAVNGESSPIAINSESSPPAYPAEAMTSGGIAIENNANHRSVA